MDYIGRSPFSIGRQNMFWNASLGRSLPRLGQAYKDPKNRLLEQSVYNIMSRRAAAIFPAITSPSAERTWISDTMIGPEPWLARGFLYSAGWPGKLDLTQVSEWGRSVIGDPALAVASLSRLQPVSAGKAFFDISQDPTSEELSDTDAIDAFFGPSMEAPYPGVEVLTQGKFDRTYPWISRECGGAFYSGAGISGRLWCSPWSEGKVTAIAPDVIRFVWPPGQVPGSSSAPGGSLRAFFWGLSMSEPWGDIKRWFKNALLAEYVLARYPFPQPFNGDGYQRFWSYFALPGFWDLIKSGAPLEEEDIRVWITFSVITHYNEMVNALNDYLGKKAKSMRQDALARTIAAAVVAIVAVAVLAPVVAAIVGGIANSAASAMNKIDAAKFQHDMTDIQDAFKDGDPAFAGQVSEAAAYVARLSNALETAIDKSTVTRTLQSSALSTGLLIGGGLAAVGALALAIFRK